MRPGGRFAGSGRRRRGPFACTELRSTELLFASPVRGVGLRSTELPLVAPVRGVGLRLTEVSFASPVRRAQLRTKLPVP